MTDFEVGKLYYIAWGLNNNPQKRRPDPDDIYGIGIFTHVQMAGTEKSYNFEPCMTISGGRIDHAYCIGEVFNQEANKSPVTQELKNLFYKLYPNLNKSLVVDLNNLIKPEITTTSIVEFIQNLETENKKLEEENKKLKDLHNSTCELLEEISNLYESYQPTNK